MPCKGRSFRISGNQQSFYTIIQTVINVYKYRSFFKKRILNFMQKA